MKVKIVKRVYKGETAYYIRYKKFLFWHSLDREKGPNGQIYYTEKYGEPLDFKHYFNTYEDALEFVNTTKLGEVADCVVKEIEI
jgi:hypothetical protein